MPSFYYNKAQEEIQNNTIDLLNDTIKMMLVKSGYVQDQDHLVVDAGGANDPVDHELTVSGYTPGWGGAGRKTCSITMQVNNTDNRVDIAIDDLVWTALAAGETIEGAILIKEGVANDTTSRLIAYFDLPGTPTNGSDVTLDFLTLGAGGNMRVENLIT